MEIISKFQGRIDSVIPQMDNNISRSYAKKLIEENRVKINNGSITKPSVLIKKGDVIFIDLPPLETLETIPENIPLDIIYEDDDLLVVNKPKNMVVHPASGNQSGTLVNALLAHCGSSLSGINGVARPGIVHRIDKNTSGLLLVAKNDNAHKKLAEQIKNHSLTRKYLAIVSGNLKESGRLDAPLGRSPKDRKKIAIVPNGRPAVTHYKPLETFEIKGKTVTLIECQLETGRTHQIRVHLASIGHPVLGDDVYGSKNAPQIKSEGQLLHAHLLGFIHPTTNKYMEFTSAPPEEFLSLLPNTLPKSFLATL